MNQEIVFDIKIATINSERNSAEGLLTEPSDKDNMSPAKIAILSLSMNVTNNYQAMAKNYDVIQ